MRFVALLRGVNVGGARRVPMAELRTLLQAEGFADTETYLQSGNVAFSADGGTVGGHARAIEAAIEREFGFPVDTLVLCCDSLVRIAAENPFLALEPRTDISWLHVTFLFQPLSAEQFDGLALPADEGERAILGDGVIYLLLPHGVGRSRLAGALGRSIKAPNTSRNWRTVTALLEMCSQD